MGTVGSHFPYDPIADRAHEICAYFGEVYAHEYAMQLTNRLAKGDEALIRASEYQFQFGLGGSITTVASAAPNLRWTQRVYWPPFGSEKVPQLLSKPQSVPSKPWHEGFLHKRGKLNTDWKKRWFVLHNRDRNYELEYREAGITLKGIISMTGMTVHSGPENTLKLEPSDRSRIYYLKAESRNDQKKWKYILQFAARKATPPVTRLPMLRLTFDAAFARTRRHFGVFDVYIPTGNEVTQLVSFIITQSQDVWLPVYSTIVPSDYSDQDRLMVQRQFKDVMHDLVHGIVSRTWRECESGLAKFRDALDDLALSRREQILSDRERMIDSCRSVVSESITDSIRQCIETKCVPFCQVAARIALKAAKHAVTSFRSRCVDMYRVSQGEKQATVDVVVGGYVTHGVAPELQLHNQLQVMTASLRFPMDGLYDCDAWILKFTRPKSFSARQQACLKLPCDVSEIKDLIAPMKLRDFENAMIFRTHKAVGRALFTVAPMLLRCETTELASGHVNEVATLMVHDLQAAVMKELSILLRTVVTADVYPKHYDACVCDNVALGFATVADAVSCVIGSAIDSAVVDMVTSCASPILQKLTPVATEPLTVISLADVTQVTGDAALATDKEFATEVV